jgi:hypothetical protein
MGCGRPRGCAPHRGWGGNRDLVLERFRGWAGRFPGNPVGVRLGFEAKPQRVLAEQPHQTADRRDAKIENEAEDDGADHRGQQQAELHPQPVERPEHARVDQRHQGEQPSAGQPPRPMRAAGIPGDRRDQGEEHGEHDAEGAVRGALDDLLARLNFMGAEVLVVHRRSGSLRNRAGSLRSRQLPHAERVSPGLVIAEEFVAAAPFCSGFRP